MKFKKTYSIAYNTSKIVVLNHKDQFLFYQLIPNFIQINDENYALYMDETNECQDIRVKSKKVSDVSNQRLSDF